MNLENVKMLELAAAHLGDLLGEVVFVGGATVEFMDYRRGGTGISTHR